MKTYTAPLLLAALNVEKSNIGTYSVQLGFTTAEVDECEEDQANLEVALENVEITNENKKSVTEVKDAVYNGDVSESVNPYPTFSLTALPFPAVKAGALSRYNNRKGRAKLASGYTEQIGVAMGYQDEPGAAIPPGSVKPVIDAASPAATGYIVGMLVSERGDADSWECRYRAKGTETWQFLGYATGKSADFTVQPTTPGQPMQIEIIVQCKKKNENYGQPSDPKYVTLNP